MPGIVVSVMTVQDCRKLALNCRKVSSFIVWFHLNATVDYWSLFAGSLLILIEVIRQVTAFVVIGQLWFETGMNLGDSVILIRFLVELNVGFDQWAFVHGWLGYFFIITVELRKPVQSSTVLSNRQRLTVQVVSLLIRTSIHLTQTIERPLPRQQIIAFQLSHRVIVFPYNIVPASQLVIVRKVVFWRVAD